MMRSSFFFQIAMQYYSQILYTPCNKSRGGESSIKPDFITLTLAKST